jgi:hypothetical protein
MKVSLSRDSKLHPYSELTLTDRDLFMLLINANSPKWSPYFNVLTFKNPLLYPSGCTFKQSTVPLSII